MRSKTHKVARLVWYACTALALAATISTAEDYIIASGENGTDEAYVADKMVYTNWLADAVLWMPFPAEKLAGTYYDYSTAGSDGSQTNAASQPTWSSANGGVYDFDGVDDYIPADMMRNENTGSISAWMSSADTSQAESVISFGDKDSGEGVFIFGTTVSKIRIFLRYDDAPANFIRILSASTVSNNTFTHIALTCDGSEYKMYLNGTEEVLDVSTGANNGKWWDDINTGVTGTGFDMIDRIGIGVNAEQDLGLYFDGVIDDVRVSITALSSNEVSSIYNDTKAKYGL